MQGYIINFNKEKGYGFIRSDEQKEDIFVHISKVRNSKRLELGQEVIFDIKKTERGLSAINVEAGAKQYSPYLIFGFISSLFVTIISLYLSQKTDFLLAYLVSINIATFLLYGYDKFISSGNKLRVPELNLQALALLGGSPLALVAQKFFRHKTIKSSFQLIYWGIVLIQVGVLVWIYR